MLELLTQDLIHAFAEDEPIAIFGWRDATRQNRRAEAQLKGFFLVWVLRACFQESLAR